MLSVQTESTIILEAIKLFDCIYVQKDREAFSTIEQSINKIFENQNTPSGPLN